MPLDLRALRGVELLVQVELDLAEDLPTVAGSEDALRSALRALVENAAAAGPLKQPVRIVTRSDGKLVNGQYVSNGPVFGLALTPDGKHMLLGCGPRVRQVSEAEVVLMPVPVK